MSIQDSFYCGYRYFRTCFLQHLHKVLCCCSGIDLHFSHQSTFISRRQNVSPPERYESCVVPWCLYLRTIVCTDERGTFRHLEIRSFFWFSHDIKQRGSEFEGRYTSNWLKWCQLVYQKLIKPWHNFLEFSKLFKGTVILVYVNFWPTGIVIQWITSEIICLQTIVG